MNLSKKGFVGNINEMTLENTDFRRVMHTGNKSQLVLMCLKPGQEIGEEVHRDVDQFFRIESGEARIIIDGEINDVMDDFGIIVPAGAKHNVINTSEFDDLKLYTIYSPANHPDGTVHETKEDADEHEKKHH